MYNFISATEKIAANIDYFSFNVTLSAKPSKESTEILEKLLIDQHLVFSVYYVDVFYFFVERRKSQIYKHK